MRRLLVFALIFAALPLVHTSCPDGFDLVQDGECRGFYGSMKLSYNQAATIAIDKCNERQEQPIIIHNDEEQSYWTSQWGTDKFLILGLVCNTSTYKWEWSDESTVDYKPAAGTNKGLNEYCKSDCIWFIGISSGYWNYACGGDSATFEIYCTAQIHPNEDLISGDACEFFDDDTEDGVCYQVGPSAENWNDAQLACRKLGANLASVHNLQENSFLRRLAVSKGAVTGLYLGATMSGKGNEFGWIDGTDWDYDNFSPGFPKAGFGDCVGMDTSTSSGQWMNIVCSAKLPVACIREHKVIPEPICGSETLKEGTIVTSPGFPYSASTPCDYFLMVDEDKRVEVEINLLEANSCCDSLILYDGYMGGVVLANLTGEIHNATYTTTSSYIMHVSWQPKGGVNVMGMAFPHSFAHLTYYEMKRRQHRKEESALIQIFAAHFPRCLSGAKFGINTFCNAYLQCLNS